LFDVQVRVALVPAVTVAGEAVNETVGKGVFVLAADEPHPLNRLVTKPRSRNNSNRPQARSRCLFIGAVLKSYSRVAPIKGNFTSPGGGNRQAC
jgi:hypothetical protein